MLTSSPFRTIPWYLGFVLIGLFLLFFKSGSATQVSDFTVSHIPSTAFRSSTFNNLVFDVVVPNKNNGVEDQLLAITFDQTESARDFYDIDKVRLWSDAQELGFQGYGVDKELGLLEWNGGCDCYGISNLNEPIGKDGLQLFVSVDITRGAVDGRKVRFTLLMLNDADRDGVFDAGESGVFVASKNNGPTNGNIENAFIQSISQTTRDIFPPLAVITNITQGQVIKDSKLTVQGKAKDQGGSTVNFVQLGIDGSYYDVVSITDNFETWQYEWKSIRDGSHTLTLKAGDFVSNSAILEREVKVTADIFDSISVANSSFTITPQEVDLAEDGSYADIEVLLRDEEGDPYASASVLFQHVSGPLVNFSPVSKTQSNMTDANGVVTFHLTAEDVGESVFTVYAMPAGYDLPSVELGEGRVTFISTKAEGSKEDDTPSNGISREDSIYTLFKYAHLPTVYLLKNNLSHSIPSEEVFFSWGLQWNQVQTVTAFEDPITHGKALKFRDGSLIKGTEAAVSVVIDRGKRAWIKNEEVFLKLGYRFEDIQVISDAELTLYKRTDDISTWVSHPNGTLIRYANSPRVYLLEDGQKRWIASETAFSANGFSFEKVFVVPGTEAYPDGPDVTDDERFRGIE